MGNRSSLEKRLAEASIDDVIKYSTGKGLKEAQSTFSKLSQSTTGTTKAGDIKRGGSKPYLLGSSTKLEHNDTSGETSVLGSKQLVQYLQQQVKQPKSLQALSKKPCVLLQVGA